MNLDSIEEFSNITQKKLKVSEEEKHCAKDFAEKGGCEGKNPKKCKKPECLKYTEKYYTEQYGLLKNVKVPPSPEHKKYITFFPKKKRSKESCILEFVKKEGCQGKFKLPNDCKDEETKSLVMDYCSEYEEGTELNKTELFSQGSRSSNLVPPPQKKKSQKRTHKKEKFGHEKQHCTGGHCENPCGGWGNCQVCSPRVCVPDVGHAAWHVEQQAIIEKRKLEEELKKAAEALEKELKQLGEFFEGVDLLNEIKKRLPSEQDIMNNLNLGAASEKVSKDLALDKIVDSLKKPLDDLNKEIEKIPESFDKIVQDIKSLDPIEILGMNNIKNTITNIFKELMIMFKDGVISGFKLSIDTTLIILKPITTVIVEFIKWLELETYFNYATIFVNIVITVLLLSTIRDLYKTMNILM